MWEHISYYLHWRYKLLKIAYLISVRASLVAQLIKNPPAMRETLVRSLGWEDPLEKGKANHSSILAWRIPWIVCPWDHKESDTTEWLSLHFRGFPSGSVVKESACNAGDPGSIPGLGRSPGEGNGNPLQYSCLEKPMDWGAWQATARGLYPWGRKESDMTEQLTHTHKC